MSLETLLYLLSLRLLKRIRQILQLLLLTAANDFAHAYLLKMLAGREPFVYNLSDLTCPCTVNAPSSELQNMSQVMSNAWNKTCCPMGKCHVYRYSLL